MAMLTIKAKSSVPPPNCAVHDEGEKLGGVITISSPRWLYSEVRGWLGAVGRVPECCGSGSVLCFTGSYIQPGFRVGCRGFLCRCCLDFLLAKNGGAIKHGVLLCDYFSTLPEPCFIVPSLYFMFLIAK